MNGLPSQFFTEIAGQPEALRRLADYYAGAEGGARLAAVPPPALLVGMGASHHGGLFAAHRLQELGRPVQAVEATEALYGAAERLAGARQMLYVSQSGASGEVLPLLDRLPAAAHITALTNDAASPLAQRAQVVLPLLAGEEQTVATKTLTNTLALLWLLQQHWTGRLDRTAFETLERLAARLAQTTEAAAEMAEQWLAQLGQAHAYAVVGAGSQAITARHAAMIIMEWLKRPAVSASVGAFRHGPIEIAQSGLGAIVFAEPGPAYTSTCQLAQALSDYGTSVLLVERGQTRRLSAPAQPSAPLDSTLLPIIDLLPVQIFAEALARARGQTPGFRHIEKVVTVI
jgi:glucosamine--fructose-6-phosphate aminotransferase (isomerizing)